MSARGVGLVSRAVRQAPSRRVLVAFYAVLAIAVAIVAALVISAGEDETAQPPIAGGYGVAGESPCLGPTVDVKPVGAIRQPRRSTDGTVGSQLRFEDGQLTGDVECTDGATQDLDATVADGIISGTLGSQPLEAEFKRDPPAPGSPKPRAARTLDGPYKVTPVSACLGSKYTLEGGGSKYELTHSNPAIRVRSATSMVCSPARSPARPASGRSQVPPSIATSRT